MFAPGRKAILSYVAGSSCQGSAQNSVWVRSKTGGRIALVAWSVFSVLCLLALYLQWLEIEGRCPAGRGSVQRPSNNPPVLWEVRRAAFGTAPAPTRRGMRAGNRRQGGRLSFAKKARVPEIGAMLCLRYWNPE